MLRDLLRLFRVASAQEARGPVELSALVRDTLDTLHPHIVDRRVRIAVGLLPPVWGQREKLRHVMSNLLGNAIKYVPIDRGEISVTAERQNGVVIVRVQDNGIGIPAPYHQRIFELFGRVPSSSTPHADESSGSGVGLALVKRIVEEHEGAVWVESAPGVGSTFLVRLPAVDGHEGSSDPA
jgi:signal transduction histidine kinase